MLFSRLCQLCLGLGVFTIVGMLSSNTRLGFKAFQTTFWIESGPERHRLLDWRAARKRQEVETLQKMI